MPGSSAPGGPRAPSRAGPGRTLAAPREIHGTDLASAPPEVRLRFLPQDRAPPEARARARPRRRAVDRDPRGQSDQDRLPRDGARPDRADPRRGDADADAVGSASAARPRAARTLATRRTP